MASTICRAQSPSARALPLLTELKASAENCLPSSSFFARTCLVTGDAWMLQELLIEHPQPKLVEHCLVNQSRGLGSARVEELVQKLYAVFAVAQRLTTLDLSSFWDSGDPPDRVCRRHLPALRQHDAGVRCSAMASPRCTGTSLTGDAFTMMDSAVRCWFSCSSFCPPDSGILCQFYTWTLLNRPWCK